ncbi:hypothetical protein [Breoghania sp. JC706]|uniref:hypothetical protein n=1 Tax=Breoghania sp. JC706 TaxID=3117732 RepID=UPI00300BC2C0
MFHDILKNKFANIISEQDHEGVLTMEKAVAYTDNFSKPALLRGLVPVDDRFTKRDFFERVPTSLEVQWRKRSGTGSVSMRGKDGSSDYNYVTGRVGPASEFLDDIFNENADTYSHLGTISSGYSDPYPWGKDLFRLVHSEIFSTPWLQVEGWRTSGHMFLGYSTEEFGEPGTGAVGSDWHMFPTMNVFVMIAGIKKWSTRPPAIGDQYRDYDLMFPTSSGREAPAGEFNADTVYLEPGDVLINPPFEWHKVLNGKGLSVGAAFRVIDDTYLNAIAERPQLDLTKAGIGADVTADTEEMAHFITSISYASRHLNRAQMLLNDLEYAYLRKGRSASVRIGH